MENFQKPEGGENKEGQLSSKFRRILNQVVLGASLIGVEVTTGCTPESQQKIVEKSLAITADAFEIAEGVTVSDEDKKHFVKSAMSMITFGVDSLIIHLDTARTEANAINQPYLKAVALVELANSTHDSTDHTNAQNAVKQVSPGHQVVLTAKLQSPNK